MISVHPLKLAHRLVTGDFSQDKNYIHLSNRSVKILSLTSVRNNISSDNELMTRIFYCNHSESEDVCIGITWGFEYTTIVDLKKKLIRYYKMRGVFSIIGDSEEILKVDDDNINLLALQYDFNRAILTEEEYSFFFE